jgi:hypothetical protein
VKGVAYKFVNPDGMVGEIKHRDHGTIRRRERDLDRIAIDHLAFKMGTGVADVVVDRADARFQGAEYLCPQSATANF